MSAPMIINALGTRIAIDPGDRPEPFSEAVELVWDAARARDGAADATLVARSTGDDAAALRAMQDDVTRTALQFVRPGVLVLRAAAVIDARGSVTLLLPGEGVELESMEYILDSFDGTVSTRLVGIDATGLVLPFREPTRMVEPDERGDADAITRTRRPVLPLPPTPRVARLIVVAQDAAPVGDKKIAIHIQDAAKALVSASVNLASVADPLRRVSQLLEACQLDAGCLRDIPTLVDARWSSTEMPETTALLARTSVGQRAGAGRDQATLDRYYRGAVLEWGELADGRCVVIQDDNGSTAFVVLDEAQTGVWNRADGAPRSALGHPDAAAGMIATGLLSTEPAWRIDGGVAWVSDEHRTTALCAASPRDSVIAMEGTAHVIWSVLVEARVATLSTLTDRCQNLFDIDSHELSHAIASLLAELETRGALIRV